MPRIAVLSGDGVGPEVVAEAVKALKAASSRFGFSLIFEEALVGGAALDHYGVPLPEETLTLCRRADAVLFGAVGGPKWDGLPRPLRPEQGILGLRKALKLYANLRPAKLFSPLADASPLKRELVEGTDLLIVRELLGGIYFGEPRGIEEIEGGKRAVDTLVYTTQEIERIAEVAFKAASQRRQKVTSVDKANVLASSELWRRTVSEVAQAYPDVALEHLYIDNCAMQLVRDPKGFDVILTENLFGDILSDEAAMVVGSIGMLPSASLGGEACPEGSRRTGLYEPVHGSAPDIAGKDQANPLAAILSAAMLLRYSLHNEEAASAIEGAVERVLAAGYRTPDILQPGAIGVGTREMGDLVAEALLSPRR